MIVKLLIAAIFIVAAGSAAIAALGQRERPFSVAPMVVLGNQVYADGTPSPRLMARLDEALGHYRNSSPNRVIIVSGGTGESGADEAEAMRGYLAAKGVPLSSIVVDSHGVNTRATAEFTVAWLKAHGLSSVVIISQYYHLPRCELAFEQAGLAKEDIGLIPAPSPELALDIFRNIPREFIGYLFYWLRLK